MITAPHQPFRNLRSPEDLLLVRRRFAGKPRTVRLPEHPYYGELCAWVNIAAGEEALFSPDGQTLFVGTPQEGQGWRLCLTPCGYLRFEGLTDENAVACESQMPVHCFLRPGRSLRLGLCLLNYAWLLRDTDYAPEAYSYNRVRLLVASGEQTPFTVCGGLEGFRETWLAPVPQQIRWEEPGWERFRGHINEFVAYNTELHNLIVQGGRSAVNVVPPLEGGGGFCPRWVSEDTVEVFSPPEFEQTSGYWFLLRVADPAGRVRRLRLRPVWRGATNMTPTFFASPDCRRWRRVTPARLELRENGTEFVAEISLSPRQAKGCYVSSAIPFLPSQRQEFLTWAEEKLGGQADEIGQSVQGRPLQVARVGPSAQSTPLQHVAILCGQHSPAETMGAHLLRPLLLEARKLGLLRRVVFHLVPTVNVDCAHYGGNGLNANRRNTNRHWFEDIQPENQAVIDYFTRLKEAGTRITFALDVHAGGTFRNHVLMGMHFPEAVPGQEETLAEQEIWHELLEHHAGLRRRDGWPLALQQLRATDWFFRTFGCPSFCLELSTCSYFDAEEGCSKPFEQQALNQLGKGLARAFAERYLKK